MVIVNKKMKMHHLGHISRYGMLFKNILRKREGMTWQPIRIHKHPEESMFRMSGL